MPIPNWTDGDFLAAFLRGLPRGRAWNKEPGSPMSVALAPLMKIYSRSAARAKYLLADAFPASALELLPEWQSSLGLPGPYASIASTETEKRNQVVARLTSGGGQSAAYFIGFAASLGYTITITQFAPFRVGQSTVGQPLNGDAWASAWQVNAPTYSVQYLKVGQTVGQPFANWGNTILQSELNRLKPAHTTLLFNYN